MQTAYDLLFELFLSTGGLGYLGPFVIVIIGYLLAKKDKGLGLIAFIVQCLIAAQYFTFIEADPAYWWQVVIILVGGMLTCVVPLMDR